MVIDVNGLRFGKTDDAVAAAAAIVGAACESFEEAVQERMGSEGLPFSQAAATEYLLLVNALCKVGVTPEP